jgi:hypothetical protein
MSGIEGVGTRVGSKAAALELGLGLASGLERERPTTTGTSRSGKVPSDARRARGATTVAATAVPATT